MKMKNCARCTNTLDIECFAIQSKKTGKIDSYCRPCRRDYNNNLYKRKDQIERKNKSNRQNKLRNSQYIYDYLKEHPCVKCGENDPVVLEFDHIDRSQKTKGVSVLASGYSMDRLKAEIEKCRVLCANCHRRHTAVQFGFYSEVVK